MLFRSNLVCTVATGPQARKVMIWDDNRQRFIGEVSVRSVVKSVKMRRDRMIIVCQNKICVYNLENLKVVNQMDTLDNPSGLCEVSQTVAPMILVCPGVIKGQVRIENDAAGRKSKFVMAHSSRIVCLAISLDGRLLATASSKGTLIRVFNTTDLSLLKEVVVLLVP